MKIELLISTKDCGIERGIPKIPEAQGTSVFLVNQTASPKPLQTSPGVRYKNILGYGLSKNRNCAIADATGDICVFSDDDCQYFPDFGDRVRRAYQEFPDADLITFQIQKGDGTPFKQNYGRLPFQHNLLTILRVSSIEITFKRQSLIKSGVRFDAEFGLGSTYPCSEENIFLADCIRAGLKVIYYPLPIVVHPEESKGAALTKENLIAKGAMLRRTYGLLGFPLIPAFILKKRNQLHGLRSSWQSLTHIFCGFNRYPKKKVLPKDQTFGLLRLFLR